MVGRENTLRADLNAVGTIKDIASSIWSKWFCRAGGST